MPEPRVKKLIVAFACNDYRNGCRTDQCDAVNVSGPRFDDAGTLLDLHGAPLRFREQGGRLKVGRRWFEASFCTQWYGSWCWDAWYMTAAEAARLVVYLRERGFACEGSDDQCGDLYHRSAPESVLLGAFRRVQREHAVAVAAASQFESKEATK